MANRLLKLIINDQEVLDALETLNTKEEILTLIRESIPDYEDDEFLTDVYNIKLAQAEDGELDMEQLAEVAGGATDWQSSGKYFGENVGWIRDYVSKQQQTKGYSKIN